MRNVAEKYSLSLSAFPQLSKILLFRFSGFPSISRFPVMPSGFPPAALTQGPQSAALLFFGALG